jgi:hypothetical protein
VVFTVNVGDSLSMDQIPSITVDEEIEYEWEYIPAVESELLGMGESATIEYLSEESIKNILFNQVYKVTFDLKDTVISSTQRNEKNLACALAEGTFSKDTTLDIADSYTDGMSIEVNGEKINDISAYWEIVLSNTGVRKLHYLVSEELDVENLKLYIQGETGTWEEREYTVEGRYIIFDFADGETGFSLKEEVKDNSKEIILIIVGMLLVIFLISYRKWASKKKSK